MRCFLFSCQDRGLNPCWNRDGNGEADDLPGASECSLTACSLAGIY